MNSMFVAVVRLRTRGRKLPRPAIANADRFRGHLVLERGVANLHVSEQSSMPLVPSLYDAQVTKVKEGSFLITGTERLGIVLEEFRQTWWCRLG